MLRDNDDALGVTSATVNEKVVITIGPGEVKDLNDDVVDHIVAALLALKNLDDKAAQKTAIQDLIALLTLVDTAASKTTFPDNSSPPNKNTDSTPNDVSNESAAVAGALTALKAVKTDLEAKHVDPADVDTAITALNTIAERRCKRWFELD